MLQTPQPPRTDTAHVFLEVYGVGTYASSHRVNCDSPSLFRLEYKCSLARRESRNQTDKRALR